jgi:predicted nucleotidyltransferase
MFYKTVIKEFIDVSREIIADKLTGIYLHGSMAMNCFNPEKSDIDLLVVIEKDINDTQKMDFMRQVVKLNNRAPKKGLEISIVKREYCKPFVYPTPFELHFSPMYLRWFRDDPEDYIKNMNGEDKDLAAHLTIINYYGMILDGEKIENVFGEVPKKDYVDSIWCDVAGAREEILKDPTYVILNLCRVLAVLKENIYLSKQLGGEWGMRHIAKKYHPLISQALDCYKSNQIIQVDKKLAREFANEMLAIIAIYKEKLNLAH